MKDYAVKMIEIVTDSADGLENQSKKTNAKIYFQLRK